MRNITLKQLRALSAVARAGSVSGAARSIHVTPPAITLHLKQLKARVGLPLFDRAGRRLRPTDATREILSAAKRIEAAIAECGDAIAALKGTGGGRVTVGAVSTAKYFAPGAFAAFKRTHPKLEMRLRIGNRGATIAAIEDYDLDFAIMGRPPEHLAMEQAVIGDHPHVIIVRPGHPMAHRRRIALAQLAGETFLLREEGSGTRTLTERMLKKVGATPAIGMEIGSNETIKQAVMAGLGVALISAHTVAVEIKERRLVVLDVIGLPIVRQWHVVKRREKALLPAAQALWNFLVTEGNRFLPDIGGFDTRRASPRHSA
jgi:DNA-binding transcriptional LysR family regulator